jgi:hypothetical protein
MTAVSMSHHALVVTLRVMIITGGCAVAYFVARHLSPRVKFSPDQAE